MRPNKLDNASIKLVKWSGSGLDLSFALVWAAANGYLEYAAKIFSNGRVDVNSGNGEAIKLAAVHNWHKIVELLISNGADLSLIKSDVPIIRRLFLLNDMRMLLLLDLNKKMYEHLL